MEKLQGAIQSLNEGQRQAVLHDHATENELLVLAGAGSGKTHVLTLRIARLIAEGSLPEKVVCVTFTVAAAEEMRERLALWLGEERASKISACTFHSLAWRMISQKPPDHSVDEGWRVLGYPSRPKILEEDEEKAKPDSSKKTEHNEKETNSTEPTITLDELTPRAVELLEKSEESLSAWRRSFHYLLVDEFQDIDPLQYRFCRTLLGDSKNFFAVGDDDQAIYGFRGADPSCILRFLENHPAAKLVKLELNYRSHPEVLHLANQIFAEKDPLLRKVLRAPENSRSAASPHPSPRVIRIDSRTGWEEMKQISLLLKAAHRSGRAWSDMALLSRTNRLCATLRKGLIHFELPEEVVVQTLHASKGLEYGMVFLVGLSNDLFPLERADLDEERRLFYVGVTRAKEQLYLCHATERYWRGKRKGFTASDFFRYHREGWKTRFWRSFNLAG